MGNPDAYKRLTEALEAKGYKTLKERAEFLGVSMQRLHNWRDRGLSDPGAKKAAPLLGWSFDRLWYGIPKAGHVSAIPQRGSLLGAVRRARFGAIISAIQNDKPATIEFWGQIDAVLLHWEKWMLPKYRAAGPGAAIPRAAPDQRKRG